MAKLPAFQFYPGDWRKDPGVQALGYHDRGVWFEILCLMHESSDRGKLMLNGQRMPEEALARTLGLDKQILTTTLTTLLTYGVAKVEQDTGIIYSNRMVKDEKLRQIRSEAGKLGGNPDLLKQNPTTQVKQIPTPSSSSSSSSSDKTQEYLSHAGAREVSRPEPKPEPITDRLALSVMAAAGYNVGFPGTSLPEWMRSIEFIRTEGYSPADVEQMSRWRSENLNGVLTAKNLASVMTNWKQNKDKKENGTNQQFTTGNRATKPTAAEIIRGRRRYQSDEDRCDG